MPSAPKWLFDTVQLLMPAGTLIEVVETTYLSKSVKKIRFKGDFKKMDFKIGAYIDFRVSDTDARRYTVSYADPENGFIELIVHLHGNVWEVIIWIT